MSGELTVTEQKRQHKEQIEALNRITKQLTRMGDLLELLSSGMYMRSNLEELLNNEEKFGEQARHLTEIGNSVCENRFTIGEETLKKLKETTN